MPDMPEFKQCGCVAKLSDFHEQHLQEVTKLVTDNGQWTHSRTQTSKYYSGETA